MNLFLISKSYTFPDFSPVSSKFPSYRNLVEVTCSLNLKIVVIGFSLSSLTIIYDTFPALTIFPFRLSQRIYINPRRHSSSHEVRFLPLAKRDISQLHRLIFLQQHILESLPVARLLGVLVGLFGEALGLEFLIFNRHIQYILY